MNQTRGERARPLAGKTSLSSVRKAIRADLNDAGMDSATVFDCLVAVTEACTNALIHGQRDDDAALPEVAWRLEVDRALFYVRDFSGEPWSRVTHPSQRRSGIPEERHGRIGGFGIELMNALMDQVDIDISRQGTVVTLVKRLGSRPRVTP